MWPSGEKKLNMSRGAYNDPALKVLGFDMLNALNDKGLFFDRRFLCDHWKEKIQGCRNYLISSFCCWTWVSTCGRVCMFQGVRVEYDNTRITHLVSEGILACLLREKEGHMVLCSPNQSLRSIHAIYTSSSNSKLHCPSSKNS